MLGVAIITEKRDIDMRFVLTTVLSAMTLAASSAAQTVMIGNVDGSLFPRMKAEVRFFDSMGNAVLPHSDELTVVDRHSTVEGARLDPYGVATRPRWSIVMSVDASESLLPARRQAVELGVEIMTRRALSYGCELALTSFNTTSVCLSGFRQTSSAMQQALRSMQPMGITDHSVGLLDATCGSFAVAGDGQFRKAIVLFTDGNSPFDVPAELLLDEALRADVSVYAIVADMVAPEWLRTLAESTGGAVIDRVRDRDIPDAYLRMMTVMVEASPATLSWTCPDSCAPVAIRRDIAVEWGGRRARRAYESPATPLTATVTPSVRTGRVSVGQVLDMSVVIRTGPSEEVITHIEREGSTAFSLPSVALPLAIPPNTEYILPLRCTVADSSALYAQFAVWMRNRPCPLRFSASGGLPGLPLPQPILTMLPFDSSGMHMLDSIDIRWEGILPSDSIDIEYSDDGRTWHRLVDRVAGMSHRVAAARFVNMPSCQFRLVRRFADAEYVSTPAPMIKKRHYYGSPNYIERSATITRTADGGYISGGWALDSLRSLSLVLLKIDAELRQQWIKYLEMPGENLYIQNVCPTADGGYIMVGMLKQEKYISICVKVDSAGTLEWMRNYADQYISEFSGVVQAADGGYIAACTYSGLYFPSACAIKISPLGDIQWIKSFQDIGDRTRGIVSDTAGNILILLRGIKSSLAVLKIDQDGNILQTMLGPDDGINNVFFPRGFCLAPDGSLFIVGYSSSGAVIMKVSPHGKQEWISTYPKAGFSYSVVASADGGCYVYGSNSKVWIQKRKSSGEEEWTYIFQGSLWIPTDESNVPTFSGNGSLLLPASSQPHVQSGIIDVGDMMIIELGTDAIEQIATNGSAVKVEDPLPFIPQTLYVQDVVEGERQEQTYPKAFVTPGKAPMFIRAIEIDTNPYVSVATETGAQRIASGDSVSLTVNVAPGAPDRFTVPMRVIFTTDTVHSRVQLLVSPNTVQIITRSVDFGTVAVGQQLRLPNLYVVRNSSAEPVGIDSVAIVGPRSGDFGVEPLDVAEIAPGDSLSVELYYHPPAGRRSSASLVLYTSKGMISVPLVGRTDAITAIDRVDVTAAETAPELYPNPTAGRLSVRYSLALANTVNIDIVDMWGRVVAMPLQGVYHLPGVHTHSFLISDIPSGVYMLRLNFGSGSYTSVFTVSR